MEVTNLSLPFGVIIIKFNALVGNTIDVIGKDAGFIKQGINFFNNQPFSSTSYFASLLPTVLCGRYNHLYSIAQPFYTFSSIPPFLVP
jgi:hypothetical protein